MWRRVLLHTVASVQAMEQATELKRERKVMTKKGAIAETLEEFCNEQ